MPILPPSAALTDKFALALGVATNGLLIPTFKGSECPYRFFVLRAPHTMSGRGPVRRSTAGDGAVHHRPAHPLDHLSGSGPGPLVQIRTTPPPPLGLRSGLCCQESAGHACAGTGGPAAG